MEKDLKLNSTESIPKEFIERANQSCKKAKVDENYNYIKDAEGNYVYEVDTDNVKTAIKDFARYFALRGVDINQIDFDEYLIEGVTLDKIPKKAITVIQLAPDYTSEHPQKSFYIFDKRSNQSLDNPLWEAGSRKLWHNNKGKKVDVGRIPDYQFLESAKNTWVIPEEVLTRDTRAIRKDREEAKSGLVNRYKKLPNRRYWNEHRYLDKSGYIIDPDKIEEKLKKFKEKRSLEKFGNYIAMAEDSINDLVSKYNTMAKTILELANKQLAGGRMSVDLEYLSRVNQDLNRNIDNLRDAAKDADQGYIYLFKNKLEDIKNFTKDYSWQKLKEIYKEALDELAISSATEGIGCKYNRVLQATEGHFIDSKIAEELERGL